MFHLSACCCGTQTDPDPPCETHVACSDVILPGVVTLTLSGTPAWAGTWQLAHRDLTTFYGYGLDGLTLMQAIARCNRVGGCGDYYAVKDGTVLVLGAYAGPEEDPCDLIITDEPMTGPCGFSDTCAVHIPMWRVHIAAGATDVAISVHYALTHPGQNALLGGSCSGTTGEPALYSKTFTNVIVDGELPEDAGPFVLDRQLGEGDASCPFPLTATVDIASIEVQEQIICAEPPVVCSPAIPYPNLVADISRTGGDALRVCLGLVNRNRWIGYGLVDCGGGVQETYIAEVTCDDGDWVFRFINEDGSWSTSIGGTIPTAMSFGSMSVTICGSADSISGIINECEDPEVCCAEPCCGLDAEGMPVTIDATFSGFSVASTSETGNQITVRLTQDSDPSCEVWLRITKICRQDDTDPNIFDFVVEVEESTDGTTWSAPYEETLVSGHDCDSENPELIYNATDSCANAVQITVTFGG